MNNNIFRKELVLGIIVLFVGASILPSISGNIDEIINTFEKKIIENVNLLVDPPEEEWNRTFGGNEYDWSHSVQQTIDGGYIITGFTSSFGAGGSDVWLIKTDDNGNEIWNNTFGGSEHEKGRFGQQISDGGYIITGETISYGIAGDVFLIKTDDNGNKLWDNNFGGTNLDRGFSVQHTNDNGYIIIGETKSFGAGNSDFWLIKTDSNGDEEWNKTFGGEEYDLGHYIQQTTDEGYIIIGITMSFGAGSNDFWLIKTDSNGDEEWNQTFGGTDADNGQCVQQTTDGGYIIFGKTDSFSLGNSDAWLIKTDSNGNKLWDKTFGGSESDWGFSVQQTKDNGYIILSNTISFGQGYNDFWLIKTDSNGDEEWNKTFGGSKVDYPAWCQQTNDGGYILVGSTASYGVGGDIWLIKVASEGNGNIEIGISGGFRVSAIIKNIGSGTATDVEWSIDLDGGLIFQGQHTEGIIDSIGPGETETVRQSSLFGIGKDVVITATADGSMKQAIAKWVLGPLVLGVT